MPQERVGANNLRSLPKSREGILHYVGNNLSKRGYGLMTGGRIRRTRYLSM